MIEVLIGDPRWTQTLPDVEQVARDAAMLALGDCAERCALAILFTDDRAMRELNGRFRGFDEPTNVLAFPAASGTDGFLGDVALAYDRCGGEAAAQGKTLANHVRHLVIHGALHLLGHDHQDDDEARRMEALEIAMLARLGAPNPYETSDDRPGHARDR